MAVKVGYTIIFSSLMLLLFIWLQVNAKNNPFFRWYTYSSFIFLGLATLLLLFSEVEQPSKTLKRVFFAVVTIALLIAIFVAISVSTFPPGGTRSYFGVKPSDVEINMQYGSTYSGKAGYAGGVEQKVVDANYSVGGVTFYYDLYGLTLSTNRSVVLNGTVWFSLYFLPNHYGGAYGTFRLMDTEAFLHNGTMSYVSFRDHLFAMMWGSDNLSAPEQRQRLNNGYRITMYFAVELEGPDYGGLKVSVPFTQSIYGDDVEVSSQLEDGVAILLCGIFAGLLISIPIERAKPNVVERLTQSTRKIDSFADRLAPKSVPETFFKKCVGCGREIPIASEECPFCGVRQNR